jgi:hypothetical protein
MGLKGWICCLIYDEEDLNWLLTLFFAHPRLIEYARIYFKVFIIDYTYNTNLIEMPLFKTIRIDVTGKSFCVYFKFTARQDEEDCI